MDVQPCTEPVGPTVPVSSDPLQMFAHFFDDEVTDLIVRETNRFALQSLTGIHQQDEGNQHGGDQGVPGVPHLHGDQPRSGD